MISNRWNGFYLAVVLCVAVVGCNQSVVDSGPSYAELVVTYNAELAALDRLEAKREKLIKEYAVTAAPSASADTLAELQGLLKSVKDFKDDTNLGATSDPNEVLDNLVDHSEEAQEIAGQLQGLLGGDSAATKSEPTPEEAAASAERKAAFDVALAGFDSEITKQKERVERARQARDAAEAKSQSSE